MSKAYHLFLYSYEPIVACFLSLLILTLFAFRMLSAKNNEHISGILVLLATAVSLEYYIVQLYACHFNFILPIGIAAIILQRIRGSSTSPLFQLLSVVFSMYLILGLIFLSSSANTWGDGGAPFGIFIVSNALMVLSYLTWKGKTLGLIGILKTLIAIVGFVLIYFSTDGFHYGDYDG